MLKDHRESSHSVQIHANPVLPPCRLDLPASKSETNRALIIQALGGFRGRVKHISSARDSQTMHRLLSSKNHTLDVIDAGTTMRFLTAYLAVKGKDRIITGTRRMCERPIGTLVDALRETGADIRYLEKEGFPPLHIRGKKPSIKEKITMRGDVSSQFISAMLMVAPVLEHGLTIELTGKIGSRPYIEMTLGIMQHFGVIHNWEGQQIHIPNQPYLERDFNVSPDWSGASYWYSFTALAEKTEILLRGFQASSFQGDRIIHQIMEPLGVSSYFDEDGVHLSRQNHEKKVSFDFSDCPDLAQTVAVVCAAKGIEGRFSGLESLKIKETDRIAALQEELRKINADLIEQKPGTWSLIPVRAGNLPEKVMIETYDDHRMAMSFAPLSTLMDMTLLHPEVVNKSYPSFWSDMKKAGYQLQFS